MASNKHYIQARFFQFSDEIDMENGVNAYLTQIQDQGYTILTIQLSMASDRAHQVLVTYQT